MSLNNFKKCIVVGTTSKDKIKLLKKVLHEEGINTKVVPCDIDSGVPDQPLDEEITRKGAENRSHRARVSNPECELSIGLEGGLMENGKGGYDLVCVACLQTQNGEMYVGVSNRRPLPTYVSARIKNGEQFGEVIRAYYKEEKYRTDSIGKKYAEELISRERSFSEAIYLAIKKRKKETSSSSASINTEK